MACVQCVVPCPVCCGYEARMSPPDADRPGAEAFLDGEDEHDDDENRETTFNDILEMFK